MVARPQPSQMAHVSTRCLKEHRKEDRAMKMDGPGAATTRPGKVTRAQSREMSKQLRIYGLMPHKTPPYPTLFLPHNSSLESSYSEGPITQNLPDSPTRASRL